MIAIQEPFEKTDPRYMVRIAIFNGTYQKKLLTNYSINLSTGGVFVETHNILPVNKEVIVKFNLPESDTVIISKARVAWTNDPGFLKKTTLPPGMGLQFLDLSLENMRTIRKYLDNVGKNALPDARISI
jgi:uncharacterized protein (TIGR02266 family)